MPAPLTHRDLNLATAERQALAAPAPGTAPEVAGAVAGLQAQHATWPYVALWTRRPTSSVSDLEQAITAGTMVKATLMRSTLHLVDAADLRAFDVASAEPRLATWRASAARAGLDLDDLNAQVRAFCSEPRTLAEIEAHLAGWHPGLDPYEHIPGGVRNAFFRLGTAGGGLVHVPPSGLWGEHGKPRYLDVDQWVPGTDPGLDEALGTTLERFLGAFGPATLADFMHWSGQRRVGAARRAVAALGDRVIERPGPQEQTYLDLADGAIPAELPASPRLLARWDSALIAYRPEARSRLIADQHRGAVYQKNGDVLPTFLIDGLVAGLWSADLRGRASRADDRTLRCRVGAESSSAGRGGRADPARSRSRGR